MGAESEQRSRPARWFSEKTEKLGLGTERAHMDSRARGPARVASDGSMTWRSVVGSDVADPVAFPRKCSPTYLTSWEFISYSFPAV